MNEETETSEPVKKLRKVWNDYNIGKEQRMHDDAILRFIVMVCVIATVILLVFAFTSKAEAAKPVFTPVDPNTIPFTWDPNQVSDVNNIAGFATVLANSQWEHRWYAWCSYDLDVRFIPSHGVAENRGSAVDPNTDEKSLVYDVYYTPSAEGVVYFKATIDIPSSPEVAVTRDFLLNVVKPAPELQLWSLLPWWIPHAEAYFEYDADPMEEKQRNWQKLAAVINWQAPTRDETDINNNIYLAYQSGEVVLP